MDHMYFVVENMQEITKAAYYDARKDARMIMFSQPFGFLWSVGAQRIAYITQDGKFYKGDLTSGQNAGDFDTFQFLGVQFTAPKAVFRRIRFHDVTKAANEAAMKEKKRA